KNRVEEEKKESFWGRLKKPFRVMAINPETFEEKWSFRLSNYNLFTLLSLLILLIVIGTSLVFIYTPLGKYLPTLYQTETQVQLQAQEKTIDSLLQVVNKNQNYITSIKKILRGDNFEDSLVHKNKPNIEVSDDEISAKKS